MPRPRPLTATEALGELRTIDYCSLLDQPNEDQMSSFELCRTEVDFDEWTIGPLVASPQAGSKPYDYPDDLPLGVRVWSYTPSPDTPGCLLWLGFDDDVWLTVGVLDAGDPPQGPADKFCEIAGEVVAGALTVIEEGRVEHASYGPDSYGSIDPCPLVTGSEFAAFGGASESPKATPSGHECVNGRIELSFGIDSRSSGTQERLGGREATVDRDLNACHVHFQRRLPDKPGFWEKATVTVSGDSDEACTLARGAAELVAPKLPQ